MFWFWVFAVLFAILWVEALAVAVLVFLDNPPAILKGFVQVAIFPFYPLASRLAEGFYSGERRILRGNLFFTFVPEGTVKIVIRGDQFEKLLFSLRGYKLDSDGFFVALAPGEMERWRPWGGLRFYGVWPILDIHVYKFAGWTSVLQDGTLRPHKEEWMDTISLREDVYYFSLERAEDKDMLPLKVEVLLTLRVVNGYRITYAMHDWLEQIINRLWSVVRDLVAQSRYEELVAQRTSLGGVLFTATAELRKEFFRKYGVEAIAVEIREIEPPEDWREMTLRRYEAEREAEALRVRVEAEAQALERRAKAEAEAIRAQQDAVRGAKGLILRFWKSRFGG